MAYTNEKTVSVFGGIGLLDALTILFVALKLCHVIDWSWWWVTAPLWGQVAIVVLVLVVIFVVGLVVGIIKGIKILIDGNRKDLM